jgi:hydrogenase expression/formation protein HypC
MCLAVPAKVIALLDHDMARVDLGGTVLEVSLALVEGVTVDDYVIVHVGHALQRLDADEAEKTLSLMAEMAALGEAQATGGAS